MNVQAFHARDGDGGHLVAIGNLRVLLCEAHGEWLAQGIEIDYAATGDSLEEAQHYFEIGLSDTVRLHLERFQTIGHLLRFAPEAFWKRLKVKDAFRLDLAVVHDLATGALSELPFDKIVYLPQHQGPHAPAA